MNKISDTDMARFIQAFTEQMVHKGYNLEYAGRLCALLVHHADDSDELPLTKEAVEEVVEKEIILARIYVGDRMEVYRWPSEFEKRYNCVSRVCIGAGKVIEILENGAVIVDIKGQLYQVESFSKK